MSGRKCPSCGQESSGRTVYCAGCGAIMPKLSLAGDDEPLAPAVAAEAARQAAKRPASGRRVRVRRSVPVLPILLLLAVSGIGFLAFSDPGIEVNLPRGVKNPSVLVNRSFAASKFTQATLSQEVINSLLLDSGKVKWDPILGFITPPEWGSLNVELIQDKVVCHLVMTLFGHPVHFSETFRLEADPGVYRLAADSATVGRLPLEGPFAGFVTPVFRSCAAPFASYLGILRTASSLVIGEGTVTFSTR